VGGAFGEQLRDRLALPRQGRLLAFRGRRVEQGAHARRPRDASLQRGSVGLEAENLARGFCQRTVLRFQQGAAAEPDHGGGVGAHEAQRRAFSQAKTGSPSASKMSRMVWRAERSMTASRSTKGSPSVRQGCGRPSICRCRGDRRGRGAREELGVRN
jgi:hypothetical protein